MSQLLTLSRAARLVGITRSTLQKKIREDALHTFEGMIQVSDLLRLYPDARLEDDSALERVTQIKAISAPKMREKPELPPPEVLASRLTGLSRDLTETKAELAHYAALATTLETRLDLLAARCVEMGSGDTAVRELAAWFKQELAQRPRIPKRKTALLAKDTFLRMIAAQVQVIPSGHEFFVEGTDSILNAGLQAGLSLNYGCSGGHCGACKARIVTGQVLKVQDATYQISQTEQNLGYVLLCCCTAVTDLLIEAAETEAKDLPIQHLPVTVKQMTRLGSDLIILHLQTPAAQNLRFMAGQSAQLRLADGKTASYPIASCPCDAQHLQFHLRYQTDIAFCQAFFTSKPPSSLQISGPEGDFVLQESGAAPLLFLAYGDGFAPIKSLIEHSISLDNAESLQLYWLAPTHADHYMDNLCRSWRDALDNFHYQPLSVALDDAPALAAALQNVRLDSDEFKRCQVYAAGPAAFLTALAAGLAQSLPPGQFHRYCTP